MVPREYRMLLGLMGWVPGARLVRRAIRQPLAKQKSLRQTPKGDMGSLARPLWTAPQGLQGRLDVFTLSDT